MAQSRLDIIINTMQRGQNPDRIASGFSGIRTQALAAGAAVAAVGAAGYAAFRELERGAGLLATEERFGRLAESIGTTAGALNNQLTPAINGMMTRAEQMQLATDLMSLGLAKSADEVVRLAAVASGLNMDMNQLVLTLTNQTTMRFDALGVSVDGFEERVAALEAAGHGVNEAFKLAFLAQAEEQIELLTGGAESAAREIERMKNAWSNARDAFSRGAIEGFIEGIGDVAIAFDDAADSAEDFAEAASRAVFGALGRLAGEAALAWEQQRILNQALDAGVIGVGEYMAALGMVGSSANDVATYFDHLRGETEDAARAAEFAADSTAQYDASLRFMAESGQLAADSQAGLERSVSRLPGVFSRAMSAARAYMNTIGGGVGFGGASGVGGLNVGKTPDPNRKTGDSLAGAFFGGYTSAADEATQATQRFNSALMSMLSTIEAGGTATDPIEAMFQAAANAGANLQDVIDLGVAAGHAREDMEAAARAVAEQQMAQRLGEQVARGAMTTEEALAELAEFQNALDTGQASLEDMASGNVLDLDYSAASAAVTEIRTIVAEAEAMSQRTFSLNVQTVVDGVASGSGMNAAQRAARRAGAA